MSVIKVLVEVYSMMVFMLSYSKHGMVEVLVILVMDIQQ